MKLGPFSPVFDAPREVPRSAARKTLGVLARDGDGWAMGPGERSALTVNGLTAARHALSHGDVLEDRWLVQFDDAGALDSGPGPLWPALRHGICSLSPTDDAEKWDAVLRATDSSPRDSLGWLAAILKSDFARRLRHLTLHLRMTSSQVDWQTFVDAHHAQAAGALFALTLKSPVPARGSVPLEAVAAAEAYGSGSRVRFSGDAPVAGWVSVEPGDRAEPRPVEAAQPAPWAVVPGDDWRHEALEAEGTGWLLRVDGEVRRFRLRGPELFELTPDLSERPFGWFTPLGRLGAFLLPQRSAFFAGDFTVQDALSTKAVAALVDTLDRHRDPAATGLRALASGAADADTWLKKLLGPWGAPSAVFGGIAPEACAHTAGFVTVLKLTPWHDFERDLPVLLKHPLLARLARLELLDSINASLHARLLTDWPQFEVVVWRRSRSLRVLSK